MERNRVTPEQMPTLIRTVVSIDAATTSEDEADETGIVVAGVDKQKGLLQHGYILEDESGVYTPKEWAEKAIRLYKGHKADLIVAESNQGGEMVRHTIQTIDPNVQVKLTFATKGKAKRFQPVANLYEQDRVHHLGTFGDMEDQMCTWHEGAKNLPSPDRADAAAWALFELMIDGYDQFMEFSSLASEEMVQRPSWRIE